MAEQIALGKIHSCGPQGLELFAPLNTLGRCRYIETARQGEHGSDDRRTIPTASKSLRDRFVDLDFVEWKARQVARRGLSRPAIV
jgi:hypothetical protein